jgi:VanZ family protein
LPPILWAALILVLTSIPTPDVGNVGFPGADKLVHGALYLVLGWLVAIASAPPGTARRRIGIILAGLALFAAFDEAHQLWISGRSAELLDWGADILGASLGVVAAQLAFSRRERLT